MTSFVSSLNFDPNIIISIFLLFSTKVFVREMTLTILIAEETDESIAVGAVSKHKKSKPFFNSNSNNN